MEILRWQAFFRQYGPLDWEREDIRDARYTWLRFGKEGTKLEDCKIYPQPKPVDPIDRAIRNVRVIEAIHRANENPEGVEVCQAHVRKIIRERAIHDAD